ncbi:hypothetical protein NAL32_07430 [Chryseobacterium sp. Ch-15]|uniref:Uncharacterized protein n=1 Tax=Chryseobacterium muglaense TaxID=2893752 RepID=A0A9Q3UPG8_9FLAO|nr:hypothetical protein [Chryseobacterium muglaense]MBD3904462.1 hypothetical protein [Chryseobacterium muglaense]MCC9032719.1 hypothetical protein [Chryseobacterium muglaense]MCM2554224.1 hypothetical protein [Chryseobacterium muglaense]
MKKVTVIFKNPHYNYNTSVNGQQSDEQIQRYFIGKHFNFGSDENENFQLCITVKIA